MQDRTWARLPHRLLLDFARDQNGGPLVEFTLIVPMFLIMMFGIIEWGNIFFVENNMLIAARQAVRELAVGNAADTSTAAIALACGSSSNPTPITGSGYTYTFTVNTNTNCTARVIDLRQCHDEYHHSGNSGFPVQLSRFCHQPETIGVGNHAAGICLPSQRGRRLPHSPNMLRIGVKQKRECKLPVEIFLRDERGAVVVAFTVMFPVFAGFLTLAVDASYIYTAKDQLQVAADAAALAGTFQLSNYQTYSSATTPGCGDGASGPTPCYAAVAMAALNMSTATVSTSNVIVGNWVAGAAGTGGTFTPWTGPYNAVKVTATYTPSLFFTRVIGAITSINLSATAIAEYGNNASSSTPWNVVTAQDISSSFSTEVGSPGVASSNAKLANLDILNCLSPTSKFGLAEFTGSSPNPPAIPLTLDTKTNFSTLENDVNAMGDCQYSSTKNGIPACSGSSVVAGMTEAVTALEAAKTTGTQSAMVIVTDGQPNCGSGSPRNCTSSSLEAAAQAEAATAAAVN